MNKNQFKLHSAAIIKAYGEVRTVWEVINTVAAQMDGKVYNKRFTDAINAQIKGVASVSVSDPYNTGKKLEIYLYNRYYQHDGGITYIDDYVMCRTIWKLDEVLSDGRIDAGKVAAKVAENISAINGKVATWEDGAKNFEKYEKKVRKALETFNNTMGDVNPLFKMYELRAYDWEHSQGYNIYNKRA